LKVMDDWQTQNKSVGCISHRPSLIRKLWKLYDELMTCDKSFCQRSKINLWRTFEKLSILCKLGPWSKVWRRHSHWW